MESVGHSIRSNQPICSALASGAGSAKPNVTLVHFKVARVLQRLLDHERVIRSFQPDVIHIHPLEFRFPYAHFVIGGKIPLIASIHSTHFIEFSDLPLDRSDINW